MSEVSSSITIWNPSDVIVIPTNVASPKDLVEYGHAMLSERDRQSIVTGFGAQGYEMVSTFIWTKAAAAMKKQVAALGMDFVGEMLGRPDLDHNSDPTIAIGDHEVVGLAEDLGMITATQALRLKHSLQLVTHFASLQEAGAATEAMEREEAVSLLRTCITSILGKPQSDAALEFAKFRSRLGAVTLQADDPDVTKIINSPYFFVRTTLSVLLSMVKEAEGAALEHSVGNTIVLLPLLWKRLGSIEKWQVGQAYAQLNAAGNLSASAGMKRALVEVKGFDYVPESLRSSAFTEAAAKVLAAHFAMNNFYNEAVPMRTLANLGSTIPMPAFAKCMEATIAVRLGNRWGEAFAAQPHAKQVLDLLRSTQWEYYFNECLARDRTLLDKLVEETNPINKWMEIVRTYVPPNFRSTNADVGALLTASRSDSAAVREKAKQLRSNLGS